jgi:hypothetical protein
VVGRSFPAKMNSNHIEFIFLEFVEHRRSTEAIDCISPVLAVLIVEAIELDLQMIDLILQPLLPILE